ncbi:MAG: methionine--tRNA ligase [Vampirovibrionales bacterium]|nr:methionine--tRNA ligase [Vampirovibrionales bacterium]
MSHPYYITTAIDYVNAAPHLGHAYEKVATDVMARFQRLIGNEVFFLTGTDEHGIKIEKTAKEKGITPQEHTDRVSQEFIKTWSELNLTYDRFIRTTEKDHYELVAKLWKKLRDKGDIYKHSYTGLYCSGCEVFMTARDLNENGECLIHQRKPDEVQEENWFFKLSSYKQKILDHIEQHPDFIWPDFRREEVKKMLEELQDISVSRPRTTVNWGIPVPDDDEQVIYVWIDALSNYITGVGCWQDEAKFEKYWGTQENPNAIHVIGKDILRFHAIYWPAMLLAADLPLPKQVVVHGFINLNNDKISKSLGNVVSPASLVERFNLPNTDAIRYYLMTVAQFGQDGNFTEEDFKLKVNADLANNLGNLLNRTLNMTNKYFEGEIPSSGQDSSLYGGFALPSEKSMAQVKAFYEGFDFQNAAHEILNWVDAANALIASKEPWNLFKENKLEELASLMHCVLNTLRQVAIALSPITPKLAQDIWTQLGYASSLTAVSWEAIVTVEIPSRQKVNLQGPILPRLDSELAGEAKKAKITQ